MRFPLCRTKWRRREKLLQEISATLEQATELQLMKEVLDRRWEMMDEQMSALYGSISLGLTAEGAVPRNTQHRESTRD